MFSLVVLTLQFVRNHVIFVPEKEFQAWRLLKRREAKRLASARRNRRRHRPEVTAYIEKKLALAEEIMSAAKIS